MPEGEESHSRETARASAGVIGPLAAILLVLEVLVAAALVTVTVTDEPAKAPRPSPAVFPAVQRLTPAGAGVEPAPGAGAVLQCLTPSLADPGFGPRLAVVVSTVRGRRLLATGPEIVTPASTIKLFTGAAALGTLGPDRRFATTVRVSPDGTTLALVGGGDPLLARSDAAALLPGAATLKDLARDTAAALAGSPRRALRLVVDDSLFHGPAVNPGWEPSYVPDDIVTRVSALWVDEGHVSPGSVRRAEDPSLAAGEVFAGLLRKQGIRVAWTGRRDASDSFTDLAAVVGPSLADTVRHVLEVSDNEAAEVLARQVAIGRGEPASVAGARAAVTAYLAEIGVDTSRLRYLDGSGLSRHNRVPVDAFVTVLRRAIVDPVLRPVLTDLPVSGFSGTLAYRFDDATATGRGTVHAKTGTLTGVHGLVGYVVTPLGVPLLVVAVADRVPTIDTVAARDGLAGVTAALAGCGA